VKRGAAHSKFAATCPECRRRRNLVWKAAQSLWDASGRAGEPQGAIVTLQKQIPMMAGLGGGSSDAAAALIGLRRLWKLRVGDAQVHALASRLRLRRAVFSSRGTAWAWAAAMSCTRSRISRGTGSF
jgi:4-diphosphocytidyl-2-C-methyl-D-erythritol kinase